MLGGPASKCLQLLHGLVNMAEPELEQAESGARQCDDRANPRVGNRQRALGMCAAVGLPSLRRLESRETAKAECERGDLVRLVSKPDGLGGTRVGSSPVASSEVEICQDRERIGEGPQSAARTCAVDRSGEHLAGAVVLLKPHQQLAVGTKRLVEAQRRRRFD